MLHDLQEKERNKPRSALSDEMDPPLDNDDGADAPPIESIDALLQSMSNAQIAQMLAREGIDYHKITDRNQFLETARQVLESKLHADSASSTSKSYVVPIFVLAAAWTLLRLYSTGGLAFLYRLVMRGVLSDDASAIESGSSASGVDDFFDE